MKTIPSALLDHMQQEVTTLAMCWKITRADGVVMGFTDHHDNMIHDGITYKAASGFTPTALASSASLDVDNMDVEGVLNSSTITEADIMAGRYDFAEVLVFQLNHAVPEQGRVMLRRGWLGEVSLQGGRFVAEVRGLAQKLSPQIGELYSPACRASLGDGRCKVNMAGYTHNGTVTAITSGRVFTDSGRGEPGTYFNTGIITFTSGNNTGISMEVKEYAGGQFVLSLPMPYPIQTGDVYTAKAGCDKTFGTCVTQFNNALNFHGEPHVPGLDRILETASTRSEW